MARQVFRRREYSAEFKQEAVRVVYARRAGGLTWARIGEELEVSPDRLREWVRQAAGAPASAGASDVFPGKGRRRRFVPAPGIPAMPGPEGGEAPEAELARLRRENARLRAERDFLKKAAAFFAQESP